MAPACGGPGQSPINIDLHRVQWDPTLGPFIFQGYDSAPPGPWTLENDGHTAGYIPWSVSPQMHVVHMNTRYQSIGEAQGHPDGLAVLAVLLT
eukprot:bmy_02460T0